MQEFNNNQKAELSKALGRVITELQKNAECSARTIAYGSNMSKTTVLMALKGNLDPQLSTFCKLAEAFYLSPSELMDMVYKELPENWSILEEQN